LYIRSINEYFQHNALDAAKLAMYNCFTDINYNDKKSMACQARTVVIFLSLTSRGELKNYLENPEEFRKKIYQV
jgi:hypothetical protein